MYSIISILAILEVPKATYYRWKKKYSHTIMNPLEELIVHQIRIKVYSFIVDMYLRNDLKMTNDLKSLAIIFH
ncbi:hypothetical protein AF332_15940 [Sporosarcina globispora]|uniref:Transposase n=1 Tax=Sporosarcina globispora TaxID=1459 RepID=A0A0M0GF79_SPOGL|nr:hypothetical protein AF332_15940 [Sporosarcina globispora]